MPSAAARAEAAEGLRLRSVTPCMGTLAVLDAWGEHADRALGRVRCELARLEGLWSRFRPGSDVTRLNGAEGRWVEVAPATAALLRRAVRLCAETQGAFDVTLGGAGLEDFDIRNDAVRMRPGTRLDFGGIGKGAAAQRAVEVFQEQRVAAALVNIGRSSIGVAGTPPGRERWHVAIEPLAAASRRVGAAWRDHRGPARSVLTFDAGFLSTSGASGGHTIDPATGEPPRSTVRSVTVLCDDGARAEAWSTALLVLDLPGLPGARAAGCEAVLVSSNGDVHVTPGLRHRESEERCD